MMMNNKYYKDDYNDNDYDNDEDEDDNDNQYEDGYKN